jgi:hypothetical protein
MERMNVVLNGKSLGYTDAAATDVRPVVAGWPSSMVGGGVRGATQCTVWTQDAADQIFAQFGRYVQTQTPWQGDLATGAQRDYLARLGVVAEAGMTKGRASALIDAARAGELGSVGGFYESGSN